MQILYYTHSTDARFFCIIKFFDFKGMNTDDAVLLSENSVTDILTILSIIKRKILSTVFLFAIIIIFYLYYLYSTYSIMSFRKCDFLKFFDVRYFISRHLNIYLADRPSIVECNVTFRAMC